MYKIQRIILFHVFLAFIAINLVRSLELKQNFIKRKKIIFKLRSLDEESTEEDNEENSDDKESLDNQGNSDDEESFDNERSSDDETPSETTTPAENSTVPSSSVRNSTVNFPIQKKSSSGLSAGAICGIVIPCIAALLGVAIAAALLKGGTVAAASGVGGQLATTISPSIPNIESSSLAQFKAVEDIPIQQQLPQTQIIEPPRPVQPVQEVVHPQVNRVIEPRRVIQTYQKPIVQRPQQIQMVPVQEVQMVPVQEVQMVPVEQVEMVPVQQMIQAPQIAAVPQVQTVPIQQIYPVGQAVGTVPQISTMSSVTNAVSQVPVGSEIVQPQTFFN